MAVLDRETRKQAKKRLKALEKELGQKIDLGELEKRLALKDLGRRLEGADLAQKLDIRELERRLRREPEPETSATGFLLGLVIGAILGAVLAIVFGKGGNSQAMDQFAQRAGALKDSAAETYHQARGDTAESGQALADQFGDDAAIEREVTGDDLVDTATDAIDSASEDVKEAVDEVRESTDQA